jgi:hypothetical protein
MSQQCIALQVTALRPVVTAVQGHNFSWLGYPADTTPSSRDFLPGLTAQQQQQQQEEGGGGGEGVTEDEGAAADAGAAGDEGGDDGEGSEGSESVLGRSSSASSSRSSVPSSWKQQVRGLAPGWRL